jgi:hypothetical protein
MHSSPKRVNMKGNSHFDLQKSVVFGQMARKLIRMNEKNRDFERDLEGFSTARLKLLLMTKTVSGKNGEESSVRVR